MSLSLPVINNLIIDRIDGMENTLHNNDTFYKTTILNLTSQINLLMKQNEEFRIRLENLENYKSEVLKRKVLEENVPLNVNYPSSSDFIDTPPPGLDKPIPINVQNRARNLRSGRATPHPQHRINSLTLRPNANWQVVKRKKNIGRRT